MFVNPQDQEQQLQFMLRVQGEVAKETGTVRTPQCLISGTAMCVASLAILVISCMAVAGHFHSPTMGWVVTGVAGGILVASLTWGQLEKRKAQILGNVIVIALFVIFGSLWGTRVLTPQQAGVGLLISYFVGGCCVQCGPAISNSLKAFKIAERMAREERNRARQQQGQAPQPGQLQQPGVQQPGQLPPLTHAEIREALVKHLSASASTTSSTASTTSTATVEVVDDD